MLPSQAQDELSSAERCLSANLNISLGAQLPRTAARLKSGEPLKIVAIGSSSTVGLWVLRSAATYPEVMRRELSRLRSNATIKVINSGQSAIRFRTTSHASSVTFSRTRLISLSGN